MAAAAALHLASGTALADAFGSGSLVAPLAPGAQTSVSFSMPPGFAPDKEVWVAYDLVALSPDDSGTGKVTLEQSFELVATALNDLYVYFDADDMESNTSSGTIAQKLAEISGQRTPEELQSMMGTELYAAYEAVNAGRGRILSGRVVRHLPAPGKSDSPLKISVERAEGIQPVALMVTVGQGSLPLEFQQKPEDSWFYKAGYIAGLMCFGWLVLRFFRRRRA